ncbi:Na+/H+ antiporter subunit E [Nitrosomonas ureae]|uniref:Multisubunit potassium/proton antiporter, PhaE subunit n=1 Tax=Nitrosomonas ureae TaxID=44577 RepID=A0A1H9EXM9_9PROT|nr:Na+/H+ antiporter subunit E [Nitrosomonas ureae]SDT92691.1 multisubunit potassium/proton antiporter, PhaE subunit [Nitrosomonas ureae]SEQ30484.1 multisubunit potassium/proton antiporter, PhaE subunit [Nitrosomonas ureae]
MTTMARLLPHPILSPTLTGLWLLLVNSITPGQIVLGLLLGWMIPLLTQRFWPEVVTIHKPFTLLRYIGILLWDIIMANFTVARLILGDLDRLKPVFIQLPLSVTSDLAISLLANSITLTPGTVSARLSEDRRYLLIHALNEADPDTLIATIKQRYERPLQEIFEQC